MKKQIFDTSKLIMVWALLVLMLCILNPKNVRACPDAVENYVQAGQLLNVLNESRTSAGLPSLRSDAGLSAMAMARAEAFAADGTNYPGQAVSETSTYMLAYEDVMDTKGALVMNENACFAGVGCLQYDGKTLWVIVMSMSPMSQTPASTSLVSICSCPVCKGLSTGSSVGVSSNESASNGSNVTKTETEPEIEPVVVEDVAASPTMPGGVVKSATNLTPSATDYTVVEAASSVREETDSNGNTTIVVEKTSVVKSVKKPAKGKIVNTSVAGKKLTVKVKAKKSQIQICKNNKFKAALTVNTKTGKAKIKLSKGVFFVRTRAKKTVKGSTMYGEWSAPKKVKIR